MKWSQEADSAIKKVPFFIRKKVRKKVEAFVREKGKMQVELSDVNALKKRFLSKGGMEKDIKGYEVSTCFGGAGCPNSSADTKALAKAIEDILQKEDLKSFLKSHVKGDLKFHHEFRVSISDCPNSCSRPQIVDIGIIGAVWPELSKEPCTLCSACVDVCDEGAVTLNDDNSCPEIDYDKCLMCGKCINVCPTETFTEKEKGFRIMIGGRLGRHPRLGMELPGIHSVDQIIAIVKQCLKFYKGHSTDGQRFSHLLEHTDQIFEDLKLN